MAAYKVLQDIEAEDHFLGPLTLKQFIFAGVTGVCLYLTAWAFVKNLWPLSFILLPIAFVTGFLAWPWSRDQPTEIWLAARLRFMIKPRKRIWNQSGVKELVTITVPKKIERALTKGLSQTEVSSRLEALANTLDSRGWAVKNINVNLYANPVYSPVYSPPVDTSDRLVPLDSLPHQVEEVEVQAADDIMDSQNNPLALQLDEMMQASAQLHRSNVMNNLQSGGNPVSGVATAAPSSPVPLQYEPTKEEESALLKKLHDQQELEAKQPEMRYGHLKVIKPVDDQSAALPAPQTPVATSSQTMTTSVDPAILELAKNDDLNVATIARQAKRESAKHIDDGEVVIPLR